MELDPGWKTYWRMPGEAGIPPEFTWTTSAPGRGQPSPSPRPARYADQSGETVGYENAVLFPVAVTPETAGAIDLALEMFFAVCKDICIPATATASIALGTAMRDPEGSARVEAALAAVPAPGAAVAAARVVMEGEQARAAAGPHGAARGHLRRNPDLGLFPRAGVFRRTAGRHVCAIDNLKDPAKLAGTQLTLTYRLNGAGLEQTVTLP